VALRRLLTGSVVVGELPLGCDLCQRGLKLVLFITGLCPSRCFYCPLSRDRRYVDVMFANEARISSVSEALEEARLMDAQGTGVTGGDPLVVLERTLEAIRALKREFGSDHHVHLYTTGLAATPAALRRLREAGLDEVRFHVFRPTPALEEARRLGFTVGVEIPMLPDRVEETVKLLGELDRAGVDFVNINELEFTETNALSLLERGYELREDSPVAAKGSREAAMAVLEWAESNTNLNVHFCPASVKDAFQTKLRLYRRAVNIAEPYELVTDDGTLLRIEVEFSDAGTLRRALARVGTLACAVEGAKLVLGVDAAEVAVKLAESLGGTAYLREYLPTPSHTLVRSERLAR